MREISEELIEKFLSGRCTEEEAAVVWDYLQKNPDDRYLLKEYERTDATSPLPEGYREEMLEAITRETIGQGLAPAGIPEIVAPVDGLPVEYLASQRRRRIRVMIGRWTIAAAAVLLILGSWWMLDHQGQTRQMPLRQQEADLWIGKVNVGHTRIQVSLPDSSRAGLAPGTVIRYRRDFGQYGKREVKVEGDVIFEVTHNKENPFIVYSEGVRTTVLGTTFQVKADSASDEIRIKLMDGKVMVGLDGLLRAGSNKDYYLQPGQEFVFAKTGRSIAINEFWHHNTGSAQSTARVTRLAPKPDSLSNWYMFNNQGLADVLDQLAAIYNVDIQYNREDLHKKYFIGKLEKKDSLQKILQDLALLNHLTVTVQHGRYIIEKQRRR